MADKDNTEKLPVDEPDLVDADSGKGAPPEKKEEEGKQLVEEETSIAKNPSEDSISDNSAVMVEHKDVEEQPRALQIVKIGNEQNGEFVGSDVLGIDEYFFRDFFRVLECLPVLL